MAIHQERPPGPPRRHRRIGAVMGLEAASLAVASLLHLAGFVHGHAGPSPPPVRGSRRRPSPSWSRAGPFPSCDAGAAALAATGFAVVGLLYGLRISTQGGDLPNVVYHATLLPVLIATFALPLRTSMHIGGNGEGAGAFQPGGRPGILNGPEQHGQAVAERRSERGQPGRGANSRQVAPGPPHED
jgi:hypothetical protein